MRQHYTDAWQEGGVGPGLTHVKSSTLTLYSRIDYWFADTTSGVALTDVTTDGDVNDSDHIAVIARYAVPATEPMAMMRPRRRGIMLALAIACESRKIARTFRFITLSHASSG